MNEININDADLMKICIDKAQNVPEAMAMFKELKESMSQESVANEPRLPFNGIKRKDLVVKPSEAISNDAIFCCVCGKKYQSLTKKHLFSHGLTREEYLELCGYPPKTALMSKDVLNRAQAQMIVAKSKRVTANSAASDPSSPSEIGE